MDLGVPGAEPSTDSGTDIVIVVEMDTGDHRYHSGSRTLGYGGVCGGQD